MKRQWFTNSALAGGMVGITVMIGFSPSDAVAQPLNCQKAQTQLELNQCASLSAGEADRQLNQVYQRLRKNRGTQLDLQLVNAEEAWIKYRDASCAFSRSRFAGGSIAPMVYSNCMARLTKQQIQELEGYLQEGNF